MDSFHIGNFGLPYKVKSTSAKGATLPVMLPWTNHFCTSAVDVLCTLGGTKCWPVPSLDDLFFLSSL